MADGTHIEWTDATWNVVNGCSVHTPGCTNCYAMKLAGTRLRNHPSRAGLTRQTKAGPVWTGEVRFNDKVLLDPLKWKRPRRIFVCAHGDLFHESVLDEWIDRVFAVMALAPQHQFQVLTKRSARMRAWFERYDASHDHNCADFVADQMAKLLGVPGAKGAARTGDQDSDWPLPNVWLGVSVEDQARADERIPDLLATPAAVRWLSCEPLLGPVDPHRWLNIDWQCSYCRGFFSGRHQPSCPACNRVGGWTGSHAFNGRHKPPRPGFPWQRGAGLDWIVAGGESGPGARPMHPDWARSLRDQCAAAGVPFLFKQWGGWLPVGQEPEEVISYARHERHRFGDGLDAYRVGKKAAGRLLDGVQHDGFPA